MSSSLRLVFLRHGACEGGNILRGVTDVPLSAEGEMQMQRRADGLLSRYGYPSRVITSPRIRCRQFACARAAEFGLSAEVLEGFAEMNYGIWDGKTFDEIYQTDGEAFDAFYRDPWSNPPLAGETMEAFESRVKEAFEQVCDQAFSASNLSPGSEPVWVVCHAGVMLVLMAHIMGLQQQAGIFNGMALPYAAAMEVTVIRHDHKYWPRLHWPG
ncbi:histidine phosphatase family protein [Shewanella submarina]|uniref:Histidine phosphatase family protein n=1 Tax=Shewanella submarina TaxID=2016376 RepID=A0ABV7G9W8_9GAMM|nr:histidine phosphatase family protein [Shewanella submarina]MCL1039344.1 histidine phosphatase family protein [Shewanella submarina]